MNSMPKTTTKAAIRPMKNAPTGVTASHPAVMATRPAREPLRVMDTSGFLYRIQVIIITAVVAVAAARLVVTKISAAERIASSPVMETVEQPLKPNQQNHRMKTPRAPRGRLWPGMARGLPSLPYLPMRGPRIFAPTRAATPPTMCTAVEPAKSWKPSWDSQPPPQIQWPEMG